MRTLWQSFLVVAVLSACSGARGAMLPLEIRQQATTHNLQSKRGVPISTVTNVPPGSDGRMPTGLNESGTYNVPTTNQFRGFISFGAIPGLTLTNWRAVSNSVILRAGTNAFSRQVAEAMRLPVALSNNLATMIFRRAQVGAPYLSRQVTYAFGSLVSVPRTDEYGVLLTNVVPETFWLPEPYTNATISHSNSGYYWSPNARRVFAAQSGPVTITWKKATVYTAANLPTGYVNTYGTRNFETNGTSIYLLFTARYVVSSSAIKTPRKIYWTEKESANLGKTVRVPTARVGGISIAYNRDFPRTVSQEYVGPGHTSPTEGNTNQPLQELRTLWYDQQQGNIHAYNAVGRVFLELLGDPHSDGQTREHLGFEIVDVLMQPEARDVAIDLGERLVPPAPGSVDDLYPEPVLQLSDITFAYQHTVVGSAGVELYAAAETANQNDCLVHWLEEGLEGLRWPALFARYQLHWPGAAAKYSHYLRPLAATETEAATTAVVLSTENVPVIQYQDALDHPRAKLTAEFKFFTWLDQSHPAHRTLLRFTVGENVAFERVYSWLDVALKNPTNLVASVAEQLDAWNPTNRSFTWPDALTAPRVVNLTNAVGERLAAPVGEAGAAGDYLAGHIHLPAGNLYHPGAYRDPFVSGFLTANLGAIIPVNAIPGSNLLEVWWMRSNNSNAGPNAGNTDKGFKTVYWPAVLGRHTIRWPANPREIVLASKLGSGTLDSFEAQGAIYFQNNPALPGYNPNEEHALMSGGIAFATRDDLNITNTAGYSSPPFVLVSYTAGDGRPAVSVFKVLREKPEAGYVFDYIVPAGQLLQPPPPLGFLAQPVEGTGENAVNYNQEPTYSGGDWPVGWLASRDTNGPYAHYRGFTYRDRHEDFWVYRGAHAGLPRLQAGTYVPTAGTNQFLPLTTATAIVGQPFRFVVHASRQDEFIQLTTSGAALPGWLQIGGLALLGTPGTSDVSSNTLELVVEDLYDHARVTNRLTLVVSTSGSAVTQGPLLLVCTNSYTGTVITYSNRPPFLAASPTPTNSFTMRYYYKTEPSFAWPGVASPPAAGSIVPYLRPFNQSTGSYVGAGQSKQTASLDIVYRPVWPVRDPKDSSKALPTLPFGATLTIPQFNLPGVRDMKTARVLYQQSISANISNALPSVVLHDPTRQKSSDLSSHSLTKVPGGVRTDYYQGKYYFPNLPPHLATRVYYDANRGTKGSLVVKGEFKNETVGESYVLLNVLRGSDLAAVKALCPAADPDYSKWTALVADLATDLETFHENPSQPGSYVPDPNRTESVDVQTLAVIDDDEIAVDSYAVSAAGPGSGYVTVVEAGGTAFTQPGDSVSLHVFKVGGDALYVGELKILAAENPLSEQVTFQHTADLGGRFDEYEYEWKIAAPVNGAPPVADSGMTAYLALVAPQTDLPRYTLGGAGLQALTDNYLVLRYRPKNGSHPLRNVWSDWTVPKLAEGWIKRVLAGINPFNQRVTDLFNNRVNTDVSLLTQAGHRWEGDVALNLETINNYGLIEIYETVLRRGRMLSIESGFNYGPANDALLLAAGYLNDLYMMLGNEAWADAANPTIGVGTKDHSYADISTALFAFKGQVSSLLEEELTLLRGRDDFLQPGVETAPVYNRLFWNYTRGIDAGEVIYAINYNIQENPNLTPDGIINAEDAAHMFPQAHGDAYGHYLTALKGYYSLLMNSCFDWVPRTEAVNVLGQAVQVDYQDERKFAAAAAAVARSGRQVFDLAWRQNYLPVRSAGWEHLAATRTNPQRTYLSGGKTNATTRYWGPDQWACRVGQGALLNWVVGNAIVPDVDPNTSHEGIQRIDRTTVPELQELVTTAADLQTAMDNAEGGLTPLGLPESGLAFDINPNVVVGTDNGTHFEQVYQRATTALNNAVAAFDDAKDVTRLMRSEQDSLAEFQATVARQELAYQNALIELYGTPYPDDIGPGKTYKQDYAGPDLIHYMYAELPEGDFPELWNFTTREEYKIDLQDLPADWVTRHLTNLNFYYTRSDTAYTQQLRYITFNIGNHGFFEKPSEWTSQRASPGKLQQAVSACIAAHGALRQALWASDGGKDDLDKLIELFRANVATYDEIRGYQRDLQIAEQTLASAKFANELFDKSMEISKKVKDEYADALKEALPEVLIAGLAAGGDMTFGARAAIQGAKAASTSLLEGLQYAASFVVKALEFATETAKRWVEFDTIGSIERAKELRDQVAELGNKISELQGNLWTINQRLRQLEDAQRNYRALIAQGDRIQQERETFRQRASAVIQGYRTRDAAFRIFRNEKLERYKTLFDLAARYSLLAANAYDYETGLLNTSAGRAFVARIISARALGVMRSGVPQYAGSDTGDPGLSSALAEMKADWDVLRGRLGFNNPDAYGTTVSLRTECLRILPDTNGAARWKDALHLARVDNVLDDRDVRRFCMQLSSANGLPVPGFILTFSTTIADGYNFFGQALAAGDHAFSPSSYATKIFGVGVALEGYRGMDDPSANSGAVNGSGGTSPADPPMWFLDPLALSATPYIYLIPVGLDSMRTPPLGDASTIRTWAVEDVAIPMPFNIGASDFSTKSLWQSADSLTEPIFALRKHQAFRPVSTATVFSRDLYGPTGTLQRSQYTNNRLVGRSVWNSTWKLVIPGKTLLNDPDEGLDRFLQTVTDIRLHLVTYSYSGN